MTENLLAQHSDLVGTVPGRIVCTRLSPVTRKRRCRQLSIASTHHSTAGTLQSTFLLSPRSQRARRSLFRNAVDATERGCPGR